MTTDTPKPARAPRKAAGSIGRRRGSCHHHCPTPDPRTTQATPRRPSRLNNPKPRRRCRCPTHAPSWSTPTLTPERPKAGEEPFKLTVNIPKSLYERASGLVWHADFTGEPPEVKSMTAFVRIALVETVARYEKQYNAGMSFPPPARLRRGRAPKLR